MDWQKLTNPEDIPSPGLLVDPERVARNIDRMISTVGRDAIKRLRPHVKSHKMTEVMQMQMDQGIHQFKAATITELEMAAASGASDVLLAYQPVGPNLDRLAGLIDRFPGTSFAAITDDLSCARSIAEKLGNERNPFRLFIDIDCGMHRTGIALGREMHSLRQWIENRRDVIFAGLHAYDGHLHQPCLEHRKKEVNSIQTALEDYAAADPPPEIIVSGSPTFRIWADATDWQCSPGTTLLWDIGYARAFPELEFEVAACLLTRVISQPGDSHICLDLGHKAIAAENPIDQRVCLQSLPDARAVIHSEEHLVLDYPEPTKLMPGDTILAFPRHICPTVALHASASIVSSGRATGQSWQVNARDRI
ncbi:MAG: D-TA family PLP-dependent enzyme [Verrucomicrobiales bacterium]|nr:D-TA family PLP-dependent enzyme [Verrucomicrobiales bacterium]MED5585702.1 D-TA family PLP-dependent enzyme [Verrucomicrobiota bacterium]